VDAVVDGFQLGGLVHHILRGGDLAAVVQPGGDVHGLPVFVVQAEVAVRPVGGVAGGAGEHLGELRHPGAVATGVGALGVDGAGHELDEGLEELLLGADQGAGLHRHRRRTRQGLDEMHQVPVGASSNHSTSRPTRSCLRSSRGTAR
jgi:hypothetical protein